MKNNISTEYAEAIFALAKEENELEKYYEDLKTVNDVFKKEPEYIELLASPSITKEEKLSVIDEAFSGRIEENIVSYIKLLCERGHTEIFGNCFDEFEKLYNISKKVIIATVTSATELTDEEKIKIKSKLQKKYGLDVELKCKVDKGILGGVVIETEDTVIDGSIKRKLRDVKEVIST